MTTHLPLKHSRTFKNGSASTVIGVGGGKPRVHVWPKYVPPGLREEVQRVPVGKPQWMWQSTCRRCGAFGMILAFWHNPATRLTTPICGACADTLEQWLALNQVTGATP
jgi:hypothetical protein